MLSGILALLLLARPGFPDTHVRGGMTESAGNTHPDNSSQPSFRTALSPTMHLSPIRTHDPMLAALILHPCPIDTKSPTVSGTCVEASRGDVSREELASRVQKRPILIAALLALRTTRLLTAKHQVKIRNYSKVGKLQQGESRTNSVAQYSNLRI